MLKNSLSLRAFFNGRVDIWDETVAEKDVTKLTRMATRLHLEPGATILDVGTGTGVFLPYMLNLIGGDGRVVAIDIADQMLLRAKDKGFQGNISYIYADIMSLPLGDEIFDTVVCYSSFPHFQDRLQALQEAYRVIRRGGWLLICHTSSRAHINEVHGQMDVVKHDTIPDADEMRSMLSTAGFSDIAIENGSDSYLAHARKPQ
ncbi:MAG: methyltransferase domain-containing protein [Dehalococcoidales bacterium]|nr:MAG: methyltransferase domain-containing protein [Dehalococcoidales bacterium]